VERIRVLGLGRRGRRGQGRWEWDISNGILDGGGIVLVGPSRDQGAQGGIGSEDPVVAVSVNPGRGKDGGETVQELEGGEAERSASGGIGPWQNVEHLVGSAADEVEALEGERRPGAVADQALEAGAIGSLDPDRGVEAEPTAVIPAEHVDPSRACPRRHGAQAALGAERGEGPSFGPYAGGPPGAGQ